MARSISLLFMDPILIHAGDHAGITSGGCRDGSAGIERRLDLIGTEPLKGQVRLVPTHPPGPTGAQYVNEDLPPSCRPPTCRRHLYRPHLHQRRREETVRGLLHRHLVLSPEIHTRYSTDGTCPIPFIFLMQSILKEKEIKT